MIIVIYSYFIRHFSRFGRRNIILSVSGLSEKLFFTKIENAFKDDLTYITEYYTIFTVYFQFPTRQKPLFRQTVLRGDFPVVFILVFIYCTETVLQ